MADPALERASEPSSWTPVVLCVLSGCTLVVTGYALGASWLGATFLGIPMGLWIIAAGLFIGARARGWGATALAGAAIWLAKSGTSLVARFGGLDAGSALEARVASLHDRVTAGTDQISIRLDLDPEDAAELDQSMFSARTRIISSANEHADAVLTRGPDAKFVLATATHTGRDAALPTWSQGEPVLFASVFPHRFDPALITLEDGPSGQLIEPGLAATLIEAAAILSRSPGRLSLEDRLVGRGPRFAGVSFEAALANAMHRMIAALRVADPNTTTAQTAARAIGAWAAGEICSETVAQRRAIMELVASVLPDDPVTMLRAAAARFADFDDDAGLDAVRTADSILRDGEVDPNVEQFGFVESEIQHARAGSMTLGRVGAGIVLAAATCSPEDLAHLGDDLQDDMRYAEWLVGRDQDRALLIRIIQALKEARVEQVTEARLAA